MACEGEVLVHLVRDHDGVVLGGQPGHDGELVTVEHPTGRVVR
jgi:hypothetical protein